MVVMRVRGWQSSCMHLEMCLRLVQWVSGCRFGNIAFYTSRYLSKTSDSSRSEAAMEFMGSMSEIKRVSPGVVLKKPHNFKDQGLAEQVANCFTVEQQILPRLGDHPRIVKYVLSQVTIPQRKAAHIITRYLGLQGDRILLGEASHGDIQTYLDSHPSTSLDQRLLWCRQIAESIDYIYSCGVLHSDLRPGNILVHEIVPGARDLLLSDFGGSVCEELKVDGKALPDGPFYSPVFGWESSVLLDLFGLGSLMYTILAGMWPYKETPGPLAGDEMLNWEEEVVHPKMKRKEFPEGDHLPRGEVILKCWKREFASAKEVEDALDKALRGQGDSFEI